MAKNTDELTLGGGELTIDNQDFGYLGGAVSVITESDVVKYETGVPRKLVAQSVVALRRRIKASAMQCSAENLCKALGFGSVTDIPAVAASTETVTAENKTFEALPQDYTPPTGTDEGLRADHPIKSGTLTVKDSTGETTYILDTDYVLDGDNILRKTAGSIESGETVKLGYQYDVAAVPASQRLNFGADWNIATLSNVKFAHTRPDGAIVTVYFPKGQVVPGSQELVFNTEANEYMSFDIEVSAVDDSANNPTCPLGYIDVQEAADSGN